MPIIILEEVIRMKVNNIPIPQSTVKPEQKKPEKEAVPKTAIEEKPAAIYDKGGPRKTEHIYDKNTILKLKRDSEEAHSQLIRIVEDMLRRQGKTLSLLGDDQLVEVDETARLEAQELIGPNGDLGAEAVSQRLVDFAIGLSGGDKSKAETLKGAIEKGFKEAEKILGELPQVSKETYKLTMEKFDAWVNGE